MSNPAPSVESGMATPRRTTRSQSAAEGATATTPNVQPTPRTTRRGRKAASAEPAVIPAKTSTSYGASGTPSVPEQVPDLNQTGAVQAIAGAFDVAGNNATGPQTGPQAGPQAGPSTGGLTNITEEVEDDGGADGGVPPGGGSNAPTGNATGNNTGGNNNTGNNNTGGNNTGNTTGSANNTGSANTFNDPSNTGHDATLGLEQQTLRGSNASRRPTPVPAVGRATPVPAVGRATPDPAVGRANPDPAVGRGTADPAFGPATPDPAVGRAAFRSRTWDSFKLSLAFLMLGIAWWFWAFGPVINAQHAIGIPHKLGHQLAERLGFGRPVEVGPGFQHGDALGKTSTTAEVALLMQRINILERRLDGTALAAAPTRQMNHFAVGAGAIIEPLITSPTKTTRRPLLQKVRAWWFGLYYPEGFGPVAALSPWDDMGDCWCAPPTGHPWAGRAQIGVLLPRKIFPTELVLEHIPASATYDIHSAPKEIELWAKIEDKAARDAVGNAIFPLLPDDSTAVNPSDFSLKFDDPTKSLDYTYIRIGKWKYDIHAPDNVQTFRVPIDMAHFDAVVNKVVVRSLSNWGVTSYTCFYRLKLHGALAFPELREEDKHQPPRSWLREVTDDLNDWVSSHWFEWL
ncbi:MAG: hypothetical protein FRX48_06895 [Lasallia pustulata]|uniref:SUN domain-containing protein n=1 Tax=Lasallia pustulata TaxID=136370 RepID=A0A5M8PKC8_9LECA|nr:MAG: hypothetical protein FRX48_06895 [Lasallia pustulata]